jgi:predicted kinase
MRAEAQGRGRLIVLCGLPGSGKSTLATVLERELRAVRLGSDEWMTALGLDLYDEAGRARVEALQRDFAILLVGLGLTVVYESGGWSRSERDTFRDAARAVGADVELRFLDVPTDVLWERLAARNAALPAASVVIPRDDLLRWVEIFERPEAEELASYDAPRG